jgi:hypothetical protein
MNASRKAGVDCVALSSFRPTDRSALPRPKLQAPTRSFSIAPDQKDFARSKLETAFTTLPVFVRINAAGTTWHEADLAAVAALNVAGIILPKAEMGENLDNIAGGPHPVLALIETARGMADARSIASTTGVARIVFGSLATAPTSASRMNGNVCSPPGLNSSWRLAAPASRRRSTG